MVRWLVESETVHREDKELYEYAVYSLFLTVTPIVLILIIGSLLGKTIPGDESRAIWLERSCGKAV